MSIVGSVALLLVGHTAGVSGGAYVISDGVLRARLSFQHAELAPLLDESKDDPLQALSIQIVRPSRACRVQGFESEPEDEDGLKVSFEARCDFKSGEVVSLRLGFLDRLPAGHRHFYEAMGGASIIEGVTHQAAADIIFSVAGERASSWGDWAPAIWLLLSALALGLGTRRRTIEVAVVSAVTGTLIVGVGAASAFAPPGAFLFLAASVFSFYLAAEVYFRKTAVRRTALAVPAGVLAALLLLAEGYAGGAAEDRVVRGLTDFVGFGLVPGLGLLATFGLLSVFWPRLASALVGLAAAVLLVTHIVA